MLTCSSSSSVKQESVQSNWQQSFSQRTKETPLKRLDRCRSFTIAPRAIADQSEWNAGYGRRERRPPGRFVSMFDFKHGILKRVQHSANKIISVLIAQFVKNFVVGIIHFYIEVVNLVSFQQRSRYLHVLLCKFKKIIVNRKYLWGSGKQEYNSKNQSDQTFFQLRSTPFIF